MSIISVNETSNISGDIDEHFNRSYMIELIVLSNSSTDGPGYIRNNVYLFGGGTWSHVRIGQYYSFNGEVDLYALCTNISAKLEEQGSTSNKWMVTCTYGKWQPDEHAENPLLQPAEVLFDGESYEHIILKDCVTGNPVKNTAGEPYDPPVTVEMDRLTFRIIRNEASPLIVSTILGYANKTNTDTWFGFAPKTVLSRRPGIERSYSQYLADNTSTGYYYKITYMFAYRPIASSGWGDGGGWQRKILNQGYKQLVGGNLVEIKDANGESLQAPSLLTGAGVATTTENYSTFDVYFTQNFGTTYNFASDIFG